MNNKVKFYFKPKKVFLPSRKALKSYIENIFNIESFDLKEVKIIFCDDPFILSLNKNFLNHDYYTDILTFNLSEEDLVGEIYISIDRVLENSKTFKVSFNKEIHRIIFHGILHLCGYNDSTEKEKKIMTIKEDTYLEEYLKNVSRGTFH